MGFGSQAVSRVEQISTDTDNARVAFASIVNAFIIQCPAEEIVFFMLFVSGGLGCCGGGERTGVRPKTLGEGIGLFFSRSFLGWVHHLRAPVDCLDEKTASVRILVDCSTPELICVP
jgi:hypothetical protein